jgi:ABC-type multidrug transport system ATPase subunit
VLVADELSLGLAPVVVDAVYEGLEQINRNGTALVVVEQQVHRVLELATWAVVLEHGAVAYEGSPDGASAAVEALMARREAAASAGVAEADAEAQAEAAGEEHGRHHLPHLHLGHGRRHLDAAEPGAAGETGGDGATEADADTGADTER